MPTASEILSSPDYQNANAATKKAIFDKHIASSNDYKNANDATKQAINKRFGIEAAQPQREDMAAPASGKAGAQQQAGQELREAFSYDPSKRGQVSGTEYLADIATGATTGAAVGGGIGLAGFGVGAIPGAIIGGVTGATGALLGTLAKDLGLGSGYQFAANMAGGVGVEGLATNALRKGLSSSVESLITQKAAGFAGKEILGIPKPVTNMATKFLEGQRTVDAAAARKVLGAEAEGGLPTLAGDEANTVRQGIAKKFEQATGSKIPAGANAEEHIYQEAGNAINKATAGTPAQPSIFAGQAGTPAQPSSFVNTSFFNRAATIEGKVNPAQATKYKAIFEDAKGNPLPGQDVINNLRAFKYGEDLPKTATAGARDARFAEGEKLEKEFNGWLMQKTGRPWQADARAAYEQVYVANARDSLPGLFADISKASGSGEMKQAAQALEGQIWNLSKTPEGKKMFLSQFVNNLDNVSVKDAKVLWREIGPEVQKRMITDPTKFKEIDAIMNGAKLPKDISRATRIVKRILTAGTAAEITTGLSNQ